MYLRFAQFLIHQFEVALGTDLGLKIRISNLELRTSILPDLQSACACIMFNADLDCIKSFIFSL